MLEAHRKVVIWLGPRPAPTVVQELQVRGLSIAYADLARARALLPRACGVVFALNPGAKGEIRGNLVDLLEEVRRHGVLPQAFVEFAHQQWFMAMLAALNATDQVRNETNPPVLAQKIAVHSPGMGANSQLAIYTDTDLSPECSFLLSRAFSDCSEIKVKQLVPGKSAEAVLCVYAVFDKQRAGGKRPLPFFVKFDTVDKIKREKGKYESLVYPFIPFHLRPNLEPSRCVLGSTMGLLVGDFVERSEPLVDVLRRGQGEQVIYSLFDQALRGWRLQAFSGLRDTLPEDPARTERLLRKGLIILTRYTPTLVACAQQRGAARQPAELLELLTSIDRFHKATGPAHRDLHAGNIRVRGNDAILIDFNAAERAPLVTDPAMLEISLVFDVHDSTENNEGWHTLADRLYDAGNLDQAPPPSIDPDEPRAWLWTAVRQIRLVGLASQLVANEYKIALAILLFRHAGFAVADDDMIAMERRAYAYVIAERLAEQLGPPLGAAVERPVQ